MSRSTIAQLELGNRSLRAEELSRLAQIYGCSPTSLLSLPDSQTEGSRDELLEDLCQAVPEYHSGSGDLDAVREVVEISRELTRLESVLGLEGYAAAPPSHAFGMPSTQWECAHQGYVAAQEERWRMNLGDAPIRDVDDTLAMMRVRATRVSLPEGMSSLYLHAPETGTLVIVNESLSIEERRFQYAHGYAHALFDRGQGWIVCRSENRSSRCELRAAAFAGRFLLPETGVRRYLHSLGKDTLGRAGGVVQKLIADVAPSNAQEVPVPVLVEGRGRKGATPISACDLVQIACYFGVSISLAAHNLRNLRYISDEELAGIESKASQGVLARATEVMGLRAARKFPKRDAFRSRLLGLAVEALRQRAIEQTQFDHTVKLVHVSLQERQALLQTIPSTSKGA